MNKVLNVLNPMNWIQTKSIFDSPLFYVLSGPVEVTSHMSILLHLDKSLKSI